MPTSCPNISVTFASSFYPHPITIAVESIDYNAEVRACFKVIAYLCDVDPGLYGPYADWRIVSVKAPRPVARDVIIGIVRDAMSRWT